MFEPVSRWAIQVGKKWKRKLNCTNHICFIFCFLRESGCRKSWEVKVMKAVPPPNSAVPYSPAPPKPEKQASPAPAPVVDAPAFSANPENSNIQDPEVDALAVYVKNLPLHATPSQLEELSRDLALLNLIVSKLEATRFRGFCYSSVESALSVTVEAMMVTSGLITLVLVLVVPRQLQSALVATHS